VLAWLGRPARDAAVMAIRKGPNQNGSGFPAIFVVKLMGVTVSPLPFTPSPPRRRLSLPG
jgi:hypothetical protein